MQQLPAERQESFTAAISQEAEEADAHKAMGKHMKKEAAQKLLCCDRHQLLFAAVSIILPAKRHLSIGKVYDPMIGDGDAVGVAGQVMEDVLRATERRLRVHDPVLAEERTKEGTESPSFGKRLKTAGKANWRFRKALFNPAVNLPRKTRLSTFTGKKNA